MLKNIEVRFATRTYEYISVNFDSIPTDEEYLKVKAFAEKHKNGIKKESDLPISQIGETFADVREKRFKDCKHQKRVAANNCLYCEGFYDAKDNNWYLEIEK